MRMSGAILSAARSVLDLLVTINKTNHVINQKISHTKTYMHCMICHLVKLTWCFSAFSLSSMKDWCSDREFGLNMISYCLLWIQRNLESNADGSGLCLPGSTLRWNQDGSQKKNEKNKTQNTLRFIRICALRHTPPSQYFTPCICQLQSRFVEKNIHKSKLSSVPYTLCESVAQNTTAEDPPRWNPRILAGWFNSLEL